MNRRWFLRLLGLAPAALVATRLPLPAPAVLMGDGGTIAPWTVVGWKTSECDYGTARAMMVTAEHRVTGERLSRGVISWHPRDYRDGGFRIVAHAQHRLLGWVDELNLRYQAGLGPTRFTEEELRRPGPRVPYSRVEREA